MRSYSILVQDLNQLRSEVLSYSLNQSANHLIQIFSTQPSDLVVEYSRVIRQHFSHSTILGQSASHCIKDGNLVDFGSLIVVTELDETRITSCVVPYTGDSQQDGEKLVEQLNVSEQTKAIICFAEQVDDKETLLFGSKDYQVFGAFNHLSVELPISGGLSQPNAFGRWVLWEDEIHRYACVAVALHNPRLQIWRGCYAEWHPIGRKFRVSSAKNGVLYELDGIPVQTIYDRYLADGNPMPFEQLYDFPLMKGEASRQKVHMPVRQLDDGAIEFDTQWQVGEEVRFCYSHPSLTVEQVRFGAHQLQAHKPESLFIYNCASRLDFLDGVDEISPLSSVANVNGVYCLGEFYRDVNHQTIMHHSLTYLAMREHEIVREQDPIPREYFRHQISPLFSLIRNAIADVDDMQANMEKTLLAQAHRLTESYRYDHRTGLKNRSVLKEKLAFIKPDEHLLTVKLTNFGQVNEKYGYQVGDKLLSDLSQYFKEHFRSRSGSGVELYSIGIGEWAIVFSSPYTGEHIRHLFTDLVDEIEHANFEPLGLPELDCLSVSICGGLLSRCDFLQDNIEDLLMKSIEARRHGMKNNRHMYDAKLLKKEEENRLEQLNWLSSVSRAVLKNKVVVYSQAIFAAHSHKKVSQECLVRLQEGNQIITPGQFLPIIEGTHIYTRLSRQMLTKVFDMMSARDEPFSINLSPQDLMSDKTLCLLESALQKTVNPARVGIEVLETEQIKDYSVMREVCNRFKQLGAKIVVDDFGSGYSNIDEIIKLEPDTIKLDGSIIRNIDQNKRQRQIAEQLVRLCHVFEAETVAEFVHNEQVCRIAEDLGVDYLQGFYLAKPALILKE